jgi:peroxiredoxin (alkyl hydroperoxide reductase subunit C)
MVPNKVPNVIFKTRVRDESVEGPNPFRWQDTSSDDIFAGRKVIVFALPGAFTPTCSSTHLPRYEELYDEFQSLGVDDIYCLSVNDAFVMFQWSKHIGAKNVKMLPDGSGEFTRKMGMLVNDGNIEKVFVEPDFGDNCPTDPFEVSDADTMLAWMKGEQAPQAKPERAAFVG